MLKDAMVSALHKTVEVFDCKLGERNETKPKHVFVKLTLNPHKDTK
jgi:hypothetical protein